VRRLVSSSALPVALAALAVAIYLWTVPNPWTDVLPTGLLAKLGRVMGVVGTVGGLLGLVLELMPERGRPTKDKAAERPAWWRSPRFRATAACAGFVVLGLTIVAQPVFRDPEPDSTAQTAAPVTSPTSGRTFATPSPSVGFAASKPASTHASAAPTAPPPRPSTVPSLTTKAAGPPPITINVTSAMYIDVDGGQGIVASDKQVPGDNNDVMIEKGQITSKGNTELAEATGTWQCGLLTDSQVPHAYPPGRWCGRTALQQRAFRLEVTEAAGVDMRTITVTYPDPA